MEGYTNEQLDQFLSLLDHYKSHPYLFVVEVIGATPTPQQKLALKAIAAPGAKLSIKSGHGVGKAQLMSEVVPTPAGDKVWAELKEGDRLFSIDGEATTITKIHPTHSLSMYQVQLNDGSSTTVSGAHLWMVKGRQERRNGKGYTVLSTEQLIKAGVRRKNGKATTSQFHLPPIAPVEYDISSQLPIDPYILGVWLGDGCRNKGTITSADSEVIEEIAARREIKKTAGEYNYSIPGLATQLRSLGIISDYSYEKKIPTDYLTSSSSADRFELLRGLLDTDGTVGTNGAVTYASTSIRLIEGIVDLVRSLGGMATIQPAVKKPYYIGKEGERVDCRDCYNVTINFPGTTKIFYIKRKQDRVKQSQGRYLLRWIVDVKPVGVADCRCVTVDREDGMYLCNDFIPTHNSAFLSWVLIWFLLTHKHCRVPCTAPSSQQMFDVLWSEVKRWHNQMNPFFAQFLDFGADKIWVVQNKATQFATARTARKENPEALAGQHADNMLMLIDEASGVPDQIFETAQGALSTEGSRVIMVSNPTRTEGYFYDSHTTNRSGWQCFTFSCLDSPLVGPTYISDMKKQYGEGSSVYNVRVLGEFPESSDDVVIPITWIEKAFKRDMESPNGQKIAGLDVARFGNDKNALVIRQGPKIIHVEGWFGMDLMQTCGKVVDLYKEKKAFDYVCVDMIGLGAGVGDRLKELGIPVVEVNVAESTAYKERFVKLRDELWWDSREFFRENRASFANPEDVEVKKLIGELASVRYSFTSAGKIKIESKGDMKKRGLQSPNYADAFNLTHHKGGSQSQTRTRDYMVSGISDNNIGY